MLHGEIVYVDGTEPVYDVIVQVGEAYTAGSTQSNDDDWQGAIADYTLHFPMDYDEDLTGRSVLVRSILCDVLGHPDHQRPEQVFGVKWRGKWDMPVRVRRTIGAQAETLVLMAKTVNRDSIGKRTKTIDTLYEGVGQARMSSGSESGRNDGTEASASYIFLVPWLDVLNDYQPQQLFIEYNGRTYDIHSVENKDEKGKTAVLRGEWRG